MTEEQTKALIRIEEHLKHIVYRLDEAYRDHEDIEKRVAQLEYRVVLWAGAIMGVTAVWSILGPFVLKSMGLT